MTAEEIIECPEGRILSESCIPVLETQRLILRAPRLEDTVAVAGLANDRHIAAMTARIPHPYTSVDAEKWVEQAWQGADSPFLITLRESGTVIGSAGFVRQSDGLTAIGYWIGTGYTGQGYATEAARAVIDYLFTVHNEQALVATCRVVNEASRHVLQKCAFQWIGAGLVRSLFLQSSVPVDKFRLERSVWSSFKAWKAPDLRLIVGE